MIKERALTRKWKHVAVMAALAMGPACDDEDESSSSRRPLLEDEDAASSGRPPTPVTGMTTYDRSAAVPGFTVDISLGGGTGEDVVLDWSSNGFSGEVTIYRSADPEALLGITLDGPLPAGVVATTVVGVTSWVDAGAASRTVQTPHYFYRVGLHTQGQGNGNAAYLRAADYAPWGQTVNEQAMDMEFGAGSWADLRYETVDVDGLLSSQYSFIYMEGGDSNASELELFVANNIAEIEAWVDAGGTLLLNSAPNEGGSQSWGFGGVTLHYYDFPTDPGHAVDPSHPIWNGPFVPTATEFTGSAYAHATVSGPGLVPHILDADGGNPNLAELDWGLGRVMFGGLTTSNFWYPTLEALNLRANIIDYLAESQPVEALQLSTMVMKTTTATAQGFNRFGLCMLDGPASAAEAYAQLGAGVVGVHQWNADTQSYMSWTPGGGTPDFPLLYGSAMVAQLDASAQPYHSLVGVVPTDEALAVSGEPGYNWTTLPVFYDGPTSTDYWLTEAGYWGVGQWHNDTQTSQFDWPDPGYEPFEMEPCGAYDMYLPGNACVTNDDCGADQLCFFVEPAACGEVAAGLCFPRPLGCEGVAESPVCGCDGQTYANQCEADLAGVGVRRAENGIACVPNGGGGGTGEVCEAGNDPLSGMPWVVCAADGDSAWVSHSNPGGGNFHPQLICESMGYDAVGTYGGTCGNVCGYCEGATSCESPGSQTFDGAGDCGMDAGGQVLCNTVMWQCLSSGGGGGGGGGGAETCGNPGGGVLVGDNGTGTGELYCYEPSDSLEIRAQKACESHFGVGQCCVITGGYQDQQYGACELGGYEGSIHWHWDYHPDGHCDPNYVPGDVVAPGWCGQIVGNFGDPLGV